MPHPSDDSRREFLRWSAAAGAAVATSSSAFAAPPEPAMPEVTLGRTGVKVSRLGMGTSWAVAESFVQRAIAAGVRYIDTSETYERGNAERAIGNVLDRTGQRKQVYLVTKNSAFERTKGSARAKSFETQLEASLQRLKTDYVDCYYMHGVRGRDIDIFRDDEVIRTVDKLKKAGKIRFVGFSCHDPMLPQIVEAAAAAGWLDQMMIQYNFRTMDGDAIRRAIDAAARAKMGIVAMKTQGGAREFEPGEKDRRMNSLLDQGLKVHQAAIKAVYNDERVHAVVSEMVNYDQLRENMGAATTPIGAKEARLLDEHRERTANRYCQGCGHHCEPAADGLPVADVLRFLRYHEAYGKREAARALYQALPDATRATLADGRHDRVDAACPHGLPVADLLRAADRLLG